MVFGLQVEIPSIQPFETALTQADWDAFHEQKRAQAEAAAKVRRLTTLDPKVPLLYSMSHYIL